MKYKINKTGAAWLIITVIALASCKKNFESINTPPQGATANATPMVYNAIVSSLPISAGEYSVLNSWIYPITQQGIVVGGSYNFDNAKLAVWQNYYQTLANYRLMQHRIDTSANPSAMNNFYAMLKTLMAYKTFKTTNYYGDMPYSQAGYAPLLQDSGFKAAFDKQSDIYDSVLTDLKWAVDHFTNDASQFSVGSYETFLNNNISLWAKFANSLRLYVAVTLYDKNSALAATHITDALSKPLLADGDDIGLWPAKISGLQFQWRQWSFSANCYLRMGTTMWDLMSSNDSTNGHGIFDLRARIFFEANDSAQWAAYPQNPNNAPSEGGAPYNPVRFTKWDSLGTGCIYSPFNLYFEQDLTSIPELMLTSAQVHFIKAEIYNRGLGVTASTAIAMAEYNAGIAASLNMWKSIAFNSNVWLVNKPGAATATPGEISAVQNSTVAAYDMANATHALSQIYAQLWIDQYRQPWDAWLLLRRTGGKTPMSTDNTQYYNANYSTYQRFVYPDEELSYNTDNWNAAGSIKDNKVKLWITK
ncbi:MAG: SusD/RagB family nutrient-binding outer membrane lipoprotein [Chitinophagaceae bacterium]|nr:SusD/RagB family nutrient-binding outer membrane lipoprotein [Chitinophagaceae bacterium]